MWLEGRWPPSPLSSDSFALHLSSGEVTVGCWGMRRAEHLSVSRCPSALGLAACAASCIPYTSPTGGAQGPPRKRQLTLRSPCLEPVLPSPLLGCSSPDFPGGAG